MFQLELHQFRRWTDRSETVLLRPSRRIGDVELIELPGLAESEQHRRPEHIEHTRFEHPSWDDDAIVGDVLRSDQVQHVNARVGDCEIRKDKTYYGEPYLVCRTFGDSETKGGLTRN